MLWEKYHVAKARTFEVRAEVVVESFRGESYGVNLRHIKRFSTEEKSLLVESPWLFLGTPPSSTKMVIAFLD